MISSTILHSYPSFKFHPFLKHPSHAIPLKPYPPISKFRNNHICSALFTDDAPFAAAIGACMFTSLLLPVSPSPEDDQDADSALTTTDARLAVMGILSFIPYFNWLVCTLPSKLFHFALSVTLQSRFSIFCRVGFSRGSILANDVMLSTLLFIWFLISGQTYHCRLKKVGCLLQAFYSASFTFSWKQALEMEIFRGFNYSGMSQISYHQGSKKEEKNLPHAQERSRDIGGWEDSQIPLQPRQHLNEDLEDDDKERNKH
ncbi:hypothetical protein ACSQ67_002834 [Phaseolus vulgaris]